MCADKMIHRASQLPARLLSTLIAGTVLLALAWPAKLSLTEAAERIQWFHLTDDEAQHTELIERLAETRRYGEWNGPPFAPRLTTGPTVILPAGLLKMTTGWSSARSGRAVVFTYHLLLLFLLGWMALDVFKPRPFSRAGKIVAVGAAIGTFHIAWRGIAENGYYLYGVLGEGACAFYLVFALFSASKRMHYLTGLAVSLAVLSKPIMAVLLVAVLLYFLWESLREKDLLIGFNGLFGILIPIGFWVGWMVLDLGATSTYYWWTKYPHTMRAVNGAGLPIGEVSYGLSFFQSQLQGHWDGLFGILKTRSIAMMGLGLLSLWLFHTPATRLAAIYATLHLGWYFLLSPGSQPRYLFPGAVACWVGFSFLVLTVARPILDRMRFLAIPLYHLVLATVLMVTGLTTKEVVDSWQANAANQRTCGLCQQLKIQEFWKNLEDYERPERIYTTSTKADKELFLTAPYQYRYFEPQQKLPKDAWVSVGDFAKPWAMDYIRRNRCRRVYTAPQSDLGFWTCP